MRIRVNFEIGHTAQRKAKPQDAFTHDWELFVRNCDGNNINRFVDKVVFNLHDSFPKPTRTIKEPPYVVKESGYGGFILPIEIHFKAGPRDEQKFVTFQYDLDILKPHSSMKYQYIISNPSSEFRHKLLDGGGVTLNSEGNPIDDRSPSDARSRVQNSSMSSITAVGSKKHKAKIDEPKPLSTFENLFGTPIQNSSASKHSPAMNTNDSHKSQKTSSKDRPSDKSSKEKKEKSKSSSSKDGGSSKESNSRKAMDDKHERREEKRKDKSHTKDRERSKEKSSKRPISPKSESRSPKRSASPASHRTTSSNSSRHESLFSATSKFDNEKSGSNSGKKSKKEKRDKSKERDRSTVESGKKEPKENKHQQIGKQQKDEKTASNKSLDKLNGAGRRDDAGSNTPKDSQSRDKLSNPSYRAYDTKPPSPPDLPPQSKSQTPNDSKKSDKHDKDGSERKHKHKKEKKNKDKDKERKKDKDKEKISKTKDLSEDSSTALNHRTTPQHSNRISTPSTTKSSSTPQQIPSQHAVPQPSLSSNLSEKSSSDYDMDDDYVTRSPPSKSDTNDTNTLIDSIKSPTRSNQSDSPKKQNDKSTTGKKVKEPKTNPNSTPKDDKKKKRKNKGGKQKSDIETVVSGGGKRKIQSPLVNDEPPTKFAKKDDEKSPKTMKTDGGKMNSRTPPVPNIISGTGGGKSTPSSSSESIPSIPDHRTRSESPTFNEKTYIAQLKALQHKIMTLQDNDELQQVVEMIAETGCYQVTNRTFDFDLCALDRTTVQRLQERLG